MIVFSHIFGVFQVNLKHGVSKNDGKITEIRQAVEMIRREDKNAQICGEWFFCIIRPHSIQTMKVRFGFMASHQFYHSGDMIRADYTPKLRKVLQVRNCLWLKNWSKIDENVKTKKVEIEGYELVKEEVYQDSINHKTLYGILNLLKNSIHKIKKCGIIYLYKHP